jgi:MFS family permease
MPHYILYIPPKDLIQCIPFLPKILRTQEFDNSPQIWAGIVLVLFVKVFAGVFAFPICAILITQSTPSRALLGTINGANQALGSLCRAIGPTIAGLMYSRSLEVSKPWIVWRYGLGIFAIVVWIGGWFLTDENRLPNANEYAPVNDRDEADIIEEEIEDEEERLLREEEDGTIGVESASPSKYILDQSGERSKGPDEDSSDDEFARRVSLHLLSREH